MVRRKKRILFDVFDVVETKSPPSRSPSKSRSKTRAALPPPPVSWTEREVRVSLGFVAALAVVVLIFLGVAYWIGLGQGARRVEDGRSPQLRVTRNSRAPARGALGRHYAVKAVEKTYIPETFQDRKDEFRAYRNLLQEKGYDLVDVWQYPDDEHPGSGKLVLWVGRGAHAGDLEDLARELWSLSFRGSWPFECAFPALFTGSPAH
ncbi:MAG TPA: hypothetical protein ENK43_11055 [Planctomycetes bacterium]|nr:hypothetical protein [Planctomycetota bacterium]